MRELLICFAIALAMRAGTVKAAMPKVRIAALKFGAVNWVMDTIQSQGFGITVGSRLVVRGYAGKAATTIAFKAGEVDLLVSDQFYGMRQRSKGRDLRFQPYSNALGALMVTPETTDLCALCARRLIDAVGAGAKLDIMPASAMIGYLWGRRRTDDAAITRFLLSVRNGQALAIADRLLVSDSGSARLVTNRHSPLSRQEHGDPSARADLQARWFPAIS